MHDFKVNFSKIAEFKIRLFSFNIFQNRFNALFILLSFLSLDSVAQIILSKSLKTIDPSDTDYSDLAFLTQKIGKSQIVLLGEPTHGEGNVTSAKIRVVNFLIKNMGFTTIAFESGFYDINRANGRENRMEEIRNALFPIWTSSQEFQPIFKTLNKVNVFGFDPQFSSENYKFYLNDLNIFLKKNEINININQLAISNLIMSMGENYEIPDSTDMLKVNIDLDLLITRLRASATSLNSKDNNFEFWIQSLTGLKALANDYAINDPNSKTQFEFKAKDSNIRDSIMASNLAYYVKAHPNEKIICWGAMTHFLLGTENIDNKELKEYNSMGYLLKNKYRLKVFSIGCLSLSGSYGTPMSGIKKVPLFALSSLDSIVSKIQSNQYYVDLNQPVFLEPLISNLLEYTPVKAVWKDVFDGILVFRKTFPPVFSNEVEKPSRKITKQSIINGKVIDKSNSSPIPFASIRLKGKNFYISSNIKGEFAIEKFLIQPFDSLQVSSVGFNARTVSIGTDALAIIKLSPNPYVLSDINVTAHKVNPAQIMKVAIEKIPLNFVSKDYIAKYYVRASSTNFDTLLHDVEYTGEIFNPEGYKKSKNDYASKVEEIKWLQKPKIKKYQIIQYSFSSRDINNIDLVNESPLFDASNLKNFIFNLNGIVIFDNQKAYSIDFIAKKQSNSITGLHYITSFTGNVLINAKNMSILSCKFEWTKDTVLLNRLAKKYYSPNGDATRKIWHDLYSDMRVIQTCSYKKGADSLYSISNGKVEWLDKRKDIMYNQDLEVHAILNAKFFNRSFNKFELADTTNLYLSDIKFDPLFWQTFNR